jgi:hypothetical protein
MIHEPTDAELDFLVHYMPAIAVEVVASVADDVHDDLLQPPCPICAAEQIGIDQGVRDAG